MGPSLPRGEAQAVLDADYRPPVKRGDLVSIPEGVKVVGIVDGVMLNDAAVGHREIIALMGRGVKVLGGGSMGALRAAELADFGMVGVGQIYEEYVSGRVEGDDEVVLSYDPYTLLPLSEPMINIRLNLQRAVARGVILEGSANALLTEMKRIFYPRRSYTLLLEMAEKLLENKEAENIRKFVEEGVEDFKQKDALFLLKAVKDFR